MRVPSPPLEGSTDVLPAAASSPERKGKGKKRKGQAPDPTSAATYFDVYGEEVRYLCTPCLAYYSLKRRCLIRAYPTETSWQIGARGN